MTFSGNIIKLGNYTNPLTEYNDQGVQFLPGRVACEYVGRATITSTLGLSFDIYNRKGEKPIIPVGARIYRVGMRIPALVGTTGEFIKLAATLAEDASTNNVLSAAAATSAYAAAVALKDTNFADAVAISGSPSTFKIWVGAAPVDPETEVTLAGTGISAATTSYILVQICYTMSVEAAPVTDYRGVKPTGNVLYP